MHWLQHWLAVHTGSVNTPGTPPNYNFFSGFGSDLSEITQAISLIALAAAFLRHQNCEVKGCWRLGRHKTAAAHRVCRKHHPDDHLTPQDVLDAHAEAIAPPPPARTTKTVAGSGT